MKDFRQIFRNMQALKTIIDPYLDETYGEDTSIDPVLCADEEEDDVPLDGPHGPPGGPHGPGNNPPPPPPPAQCA